MNPVLKKLSAPGQSASQLAHLLQKHVGSGGSEQICLEACEALARIRDAKQLSAVMATVTLLREDRSSCQIIIEVIALLRGFEQMNIDRV